MKKSLLLFCVAGIVITGCKSEPEKTEAAEEPVKIERPNVTSIYEVGGNWTDQNNKPVALDDLKGNIQVATMVFTNCPYACPRITADLQAIEEKIPADIKDDVRFLLVSFDTERDTPERLNQFYKEMGLNEKWTLLHGNEEDVRTLSVVLNVQYEKLEDGSFSHSNIVTVLDQNGAIRFQQEGLEKDPAEAVKVISELHGNK